MVDEGGAAGVVVGALVVVAPLDPELLLELELATGVGGAGT